MEVDKLTVYINITKTLFSPQLLTAARGGNINAAFESAARGQALAAAASQARLKRNTSSHAVLESGSTTLSIASCHLSCFLTLLSHVIIVVDRPMKRIRHGSIGSASSSSYLNQIQLESGVLAVRSRTSSCAYEYLPGPFSKEALAIISTDDASGELLDDALILIQSLFVQLSFFVVF